MPEPSSPAVAGPEDQPAPSLLLSTEPDPASTESIEAGAAEVIDLEPANTAGPESTEVVGPEPDDTGEEVSSPSAPAIQRRFTRRNGLLGLVLALVLLVGGWTLVTFNTVREQATSAAGHLNAAYDL